MTISAVYYFIVLVILGVAEFTNSGKLSPQSLVNLYCEAVGFPKINVSYYGEDIHLDSKIFQLSKSMDIRRNVKDAVNYTCSMKNGTIVHKLLRYDKQPNRKHDTIMDDSFNSIPYFCHQVLDVKMETNLSIFSKEWVICEIEELLFEPNHGPLDIFISSLIVFFICSCVIIAFIFKRFVLERKKIPKIDNLQKVLDPVVLRSLLSTSNKNRIRV